MTICTQIKEAWLLAGAPHDQDRELNQTEHELDWAAVPALPPAWLPHRSQGSLTPPQIEISIYEDRCSSGSSSSGSSSGSGLSSGGGGGAGAR